MKTFCRFLEFYLHFFLSHPHALSSFFCLVVLAKTSSTMMNLKQESVQSIIISYDVGCRFLLDFFNQLFEQVLFITSLLRDLIMSWYWIFVKCLPWICWNTFFVCFLVCWFGELPWLIFRLLIPLYIWGENTTWSWYIIVLVYYWIQYANILLKMFNLHLCSWETSSVAFILFLYQGNIDLKNVLDMFYLFYFLEEFCRIGMISSLHVW